MAPLYRPALKGTWHPCDGWKGLAITALHNGRGYFMVVASQGSISSNRPAFEEARRSFRFIH
jgi:hypothetical protein